MQKTTRHFAFQRHTSAGRRRAFSLSELMIAIVIFGVGMIMVATTFPVGIDQCRIVAEESVLPLVADQSRVELQFLLEDQRKLFDSNTKTFKQAVSALSHNNLTNELYGLDINTVLGLNRRVYPADTQADPLYTWSTVVRKDEDRNYVEFVVFVSRKDDVADRLELVTDGPDAGDEGGITINGGSVRTLYDDGTPIDFAEDTHIVIDYGAISQIVAGEKAWDPQNERMIDMHLLMKPGDVRTGQSAFWYIPAKASERRSPCLEVYKFSFPLD
jgi:prepilin-type N-terminal cleavage/methylation domain-containing protein